MNDDVKIITDLENKGLDMECAIQIMMHMIGMYPEGERKKYTRYGETYYRPYRNYYAGKNEYLEYFCEMDMCRKWSNEGFIPKDQINYELTRKGLNFLGRQLKVTILNEER